MCLEETDKREGGGKVGGVTQKLGLFECAVLPRCVLGEDILC